MKIIVKGKEVSIRGRVGIDLWMWLRKAAMLFKKPLVLPTVEQCESYVLATTWTGRYDCLWTLALLSDVKRVAKRMPAECRHNIIVPTARYNVPTRKHVAFLCDIISRGLDPRDVTLSI